MIPQLLSLASRVALLAAVVFTTTVVASAETPDLRVNIRSFVEYKGMKKPTSEELTEAKAHQRIYMIAQVHLIKTTTKMIQPVNEPVLVSELKKTLAHNGYEEAYVGGPAPEIVLYVYYGRCWLTNPYLAGATDQGGLESYATVSPSFTQLFNQHQPGYEEKLQRANSEKLAIYVLAFKRPTGRVKEKPQLLWTTLMNIDSPDYRDLNVFAEEMLAVGGGYFGQTSEKEETEVFKPLPDGHVTAGETKVIETDVPLPKK